MTPEQLVAGRQKAVSAARALLSLELGFYVGAKRVFNALEHLDGDLPPQYPVFGKFLASVPAALPVSHARLVCTTSYLFESDATLAALEARFRAPLLQACILVIEAFGPPSSPQSPSKMSSSDA